MQKVAIFGSTGSIGTQSLEILSKHKDKFEVVFLSARKNKELLEKQISDFSVKQSYLGEDTRELGGLAKGLDYDIAINSLVGISGFLPSYEIVKRGKTLALANKESLVTGGNLIMPLANKTGTKIFPIDSEHSAIWQCLNGENIKDAEKIILTASGGPFFGRSLQDLEKVTVKDALNHPNWSMGSKITIDSATMMNKGFEVIEAFHLFGKIRTEVIIHKESIIHSAVEFKDGAIIAQLGAPDMKVPISYALSLPERWETGVRRVNFFDIKNLSFAKPDLETFPLLAFAFESLERKNSYAIMLNALNEVLVQKFLEEKIAFLDIQRTIAKTLEKHKDFEITEAEDILAFDTACRANSF
jgi:1-deoxy-D-xylulose-5-phosphate reductoisomerase